MDRLMDRRSVLVGKRDERGRLLRPTERALLERELAPIATMAAYRMGMAARHRISVATPAEPIEAMSVSASFFDVIGLSPRLGRYFTPEEERAGQPLIVISERTWRTAFGGADVLGMTLRIDARNRS